MMNATQCPPESALADFGLGKLDAAQAETIRRHLEACADCRQRVAGVSGDSFVGRLREADAGDKSAARRERTYVQGESMANAANGTDGSSVREDGLPRPSPTVADNAIRDGLGRPSSEKDGLVPARRDSISAPPELANHPDYELIKELGQGGMGTVYLAKNRMMDRLEVLKVISKELLARPGALERFQQEIRSAAKLAHPNIVAAYSVLRPGELLVFAMEYVKGQDLSQVVKQRGPLPVANAAFYIHQVANGLQHAHEKGMVHRDIKPNNLMLAIEGKKHIVKILDFGLAKATSEKGGETGLTKSGQMLGTPDYVAPEQTLDAHKADIRADIYSLGCTLYFLLSGGPPFQEQSLFEILQAHHTRDPRPLNLVRPEVPAELAAVVAKMMAKDPAKRYQTPIEVAKALVPFFKPGQTIAPPPSEKPSSDTEYPQYTVETPPRPQSMTPPSFAGQPSPFPVPVAPVPLGAVMVPVQAAPPAEDFSVSINLKRPAIRRRSGWSSLPPWQRWTALGGAAAALLLGIVLLVRTPRGTIEIELSDPDAKVTVAVDGNRVDIAGLDEPLSLEVGEHEYTVKGDGFETRTKRFQVTRGKNAPLTITLAPKSQPALQNSKAETVAAPRRQPSPAPRNTTDAGETTTDGFVSLFNGKDLTGWKTHPSRQGLWRVQNGVLIGSGPATSYLFTERGNFTNIHLRAEARINDGGDGGMYARSTFSAEQWIDGYEAQINSTGSDKNKTGSLCKRSGAVYSVLSDPVGPNEWFTLELIAADNHITLKVNGQTTTDCADSARSYPMGHIALQQHDPQSVVEFRKIEIKEINTGEGTPATEAESGIIGTAPSDAPPRAIAPFGAKQARAYQETWAKHLGVPVEQTNSVGMKLVLIPPGEFTMGSTPEQVEAAKKITEELKESRDGWILERLDDELPAHRVTITRPFLLGPTEVTVAQFRSFVDATGYITDAERYGSGNSNSTDEKAPNRKQLTWRAPGHVIAENSNVSQVSWNDAVEFCNWLSETENLTMCYRRDNMAGWLFESSGAGYRLPTEAEWEYACRAGTATQFSFGDDPAAFPKYGWKERFGPIPRPISVAAKLPNAFDLYDMHGNVFEWCQDWHGRDYYAKSPAADPFGPSSPGMRARRGGNWGWLPLALCRSANRFPDWPTLRHDDTGFRTLRVSTNPIMPAASNDIATRLPPAQASVTAKSAANSSDTAKVAGPISKTSSPADGPTEAADDTKLTAKEAFSLRQHTAAATRVAFHRSKPLLASGGEDGQVLLWNLADRAAQTTLYKFPRTQIWAIKFSPDGRAVAHTSRYRNGSKVYFKTLSGQVLKAVSDFKTVGAVASIAYSPDGRLFAAGQDDGSIRLWDMAQFKEIAPVSFGVGHNIHRLAFGQVTFGRKNGTEYLLAAGGKEGMVRTLTATLVKTKNAAQWTFAPTDVQFPKGAPVWGVRFSANGELLGFSRDDGNVCLCDPRTGATVRDLASGARGKHVVDWIAFHPLRPWCVTAHKTDQAARIWNTETAELLCELKGHTGGVLCAEFSPDGRQVATASEDFSIKLWDLSGPEVPTAKQGNNARSAALTVGD